MPENSGQLPRRCPWCGESVESLNVNCAFCGRLPDDRAWVDSVHAQAESLLPPGWEGLTTFQPLNSIATVAGYLWGELQTLRLFGEKGRGEFWLETANELYANVFRTLDKLQISDRPEQQPKAIDCDEAERRLAELWRWCDAQGGDAEPAEQDNEKPLESNVASKPRGRRKADYETVQREAKLAADWERARESRVYKTDFAKQKGMALVQLDALLDRVAKRKARSDK